MQAIKPLSSTTILTSDVPACVHEFIPSSVSTDGLKLTDTINGIQLIESGGGRFALASSGATFTHAAGTPSMSANFLSPALGVDMALIIVPKIGELANSTLTGVGIPSTSGAGIEATINGSGYVSASSNDYANLTNRNSAVTAANVRAIGVVSKRATNDLLKVISEDTVLDSSAKNVAGSSGNIANAWGAMSTWTIPPSKEFYSMHVLHLTNGAPADFAAGVQWMGLNPGKGLFPGWKGLV